MVDDYDWWREALDGHIGAVHDGETHCGFFRLRTSESSGKRGAAKFIGAKAVAIWKDDSGQYAASVDGYVAANVAELFLLVCKYPVSEELFRDYRNGIEWPDVAAAMEKK